MENLKIWCVFEAKSLEMGIFSKKSLHMVTYFWKNYPWAWAWVLSRRRHVTDEAKSDRARGGGGGGMTRLNYVDKYGAPAGPEQNFKSFKKNVILL